MGNPLADRMEAIRRQVRSLAWRHGILLLAAAAVAGIVAAGLCDWLLHVSGGLRLLFAGAIAGTAGWLAWRWLALPMRAPIRDLDVALRLERAHPEFGERLSSALQFHAAPDGDPLAGSRELRRHVVEQALGDLEHADAARILDGAPVRRAAKYAFAAGGVAAALAIASPLDAKTALLRLAAPFGDHPWPKRTSIEIVEAKPKAAQGDPYAVVVKTGGRVPPRARIEYREADGKAIVRADMLAEADGVFRATREAVVRPFAFSVSAGDDQTEWREIAVAPAPQESGLQLSVRFPAYTGLPIENYPEGRGHLQAVVGTVVSLRAHANKPLAEAALVWDKGPATPAQVADDGGTLAATFPVTIDNAYRLRLLDREGMSNAERGPRTHRVEALPDLPPELALEQPSADQEITVNATVPIRAVVKDDFGVGPIDLVYAIARRRKDANAPVADKLEELRQPLLRPDANSKRQAVAFAWPVAALKLEPGDTLSLRLEAQDRRDVPGPNVGRSREVHLRVVSKEDFLAALDAQQGRVREELQRAAELQQSALKQTGDALRQAEAGAELKAEDRDRLANAEATQRNIRGKLADPDQGLGKKVGQLLQSLRDNQVADPNSARRLAMVQSELGRLAEQQFPPLDQALSRARRELDRPGPKQAGAKAADPPGAAKAAAGKADLAEAKQRQENVAGALDDMLQQLAEWETVAQAMTDARNLQRQQAEANNKVADLTDGDALAGQEKGDLQPEQKAALDRAADRQGAAKDQLGKLEKSLNRLADKAAKEDPLSAQALKQALGKARERDLAGAMQKAEQAVRENQLGGAREKQQDIAKQIADMVEQLDSRRELELGLLVKQLSDAEREAQALSRQQQLLRKQAKNAQAEKDPVRRDSELKRLRKEQQQLAKKAEDLARRLSKMQAQRGSRNAGRAAARMDEAGQQLDNGDPQGADQQQEQALQELQEAVKEMAQERREREAELRDEQFAKLNDLLKAVHERQVAAETEFKRLHEAKEKGAATRTQLQSVRALGRTENGLADEAKGLSGKASAAKVFTLALEQAAARLGKAGTKLQDRAAWPEARPDVSKATQRLAALVAALEQQRQQRQAARQQQQQQDGDDPEGGGGEGGEGDGIADLAQLRLLIALQKELREGTSALVAAKHGGGKWSPADEKELQELSERQGQLADLARDLAAPKDAKDPEPNEPGAAEGPRGPPKDAKEKKGGAKAAGKRKDDDL